MNDLKQVRIDHRLKQYELAELAGISNVQLCNIEKGKCSARPDTRERIEAVLRCQIDWISAKVQVRQPSYAEGQNLLKKLLETMVLMDSRDRKRLTALVNRYFQI